MYEMRKTIHGETKHQLNERFGEHRHSILNHHHLINPTPVSTHFNQPGHSINDILLIPLELIHNKRLGQKGTRGSSYR